VPPVEAPAVAPEYLERFIADAHVIVAEGFARIDPATLSTKEEPTISGLIVRNARTWIDGPESPGWTVGYFVTEEKFEDESPLEGMARPRIDVHVESNIRKPRPRFVFEAKRLHRSDSVAQYVGEGGLGALRDGTYAGSTHSAGMLGYVQRGDVEGWAEKVRGKLDRERELHGLSADGVVWTELLLDSRLGSTRRSRHARPERATVDVYHSFLKCCA
jgi:hypothetical protein